MSQTYTTPGTFTYTVPAGCIFLLLRGWGAGAGGGGNTNTTGAGGGGGGAFSQVNKLAVIAGHQYTIVVPSGGGQTQAGGDFEIWDGPVGTGTLILRAKGGSTGSPGTPTAQGAGGAGGQASAGTGDVKFSGGSGGGGGGVVTNGGGGGSSASPSSNGINGNSNGTGATGNPPLFGGGGTGATLLAGATAGGAPGGGGGGTSSAQAGAPNGAAGRGEIYETFSYSGSAGFTFSAALGHFTILKPLSASFHFAAALSKLVQKNLSAGFTFTAAVAKKVVLLPKQAGFSFAAALFVQLPQAVLNRLGGAARRLFVSLFDD